MKKFLRLLLMASVVLAGLAFAQSGTFGTKDIASGPRCVTKYISSAGSYRLVGDLDFSSCGKCSISAITIAADDVSLDLNGHTVKGPNCFADGFNLIDGTDAHRAYIHHGHVLNGADDGIHVGADAKIEEVFVSGSHGEGISASESALILHCVIDGNQGAGIETEDGGTVIGNVINQNGEDPSFNQAGLECDTSDPADRCTAFNNTLRRNGNAADGSKCFDDATRWVTNNSNSCDGTLKQSLLTGGSSGNGNIASNGMRLKGGSAAHKGREVDKTHRCGNQHLSEEEMKALFVEIRESLPELRTEEFILDED